MKRTIEKLLNDIQQNKVGEVCFISKEASLITVTYLQDAGFRMIGDNEHVVEQDMYVAYFILDNKRLAENLTKNYKQEYKAGDYVCYTLKHELGKVKRVSENGQQIFVWYHLGDTAANTPEDFLQPVISNEEAKKLSESQLKACLLTEEFSNAYVIDNFIKRKSE